MMPTAGETCGRNFGWLPAVIALGRTVVSAPVNRPTFDLQSHSTHSDGTLPAAEVVAYAGRAGLELFALTDHDTVGGVDEALEAAKRHGLRLLRAAELSAVDGAYEDLHILGYDIDHHDPTLLERLQLARADREVRIERMRERLVGHGWAVEEQELEERRLEGKPVGRPHLAGAVMVHADNAERLAHEGHADLSSFLVAYLLPGTPGYVARDFPTVSEAIGWIHDAGGLAVWAHPFWDVQSPDEVIAILERFRHKGIDGVEAFYVAHDAQQTALLVEHAPALDLITTGSSDFHGPEHTIFSRVADFSLHGLEPRLGPLASSDGGPA